MTQCSIELDLKSLNNQIARRSFGDVREFKSLAGVNGWVLVYIAESKGDVFQKDLEAEFAVSRSAASKMIHHLERRGLLVKQSVAQDGRLRKLTLTEQGAVLAQDMRASVKQTHQALINGFSSEELEQLGAFITRMRRNLSSR